MSGESQRSWRVFRTFLSTRQIKSLKGPESSKLNLPFAVGPQPTPQRVYVALNRVDITGRDTITRIYAWK